MHTTCKEFYICVTECEGVENYELQTATDTVGNSIEFLVYHRKQTGLPSSFFADKPLVRVAKVRVTEIESVKV